MFHRFEETARKTSIADGRLSRMYNQWQFFTPYTNYFQILISVSFMTKVNDVTDWLSQTTDIARYSVWSLDFDMKRVTCILCGMILSLALHIIYAFTFFFYSLTPVHLISD